MTDPPLKAAMFIDKGGTGKTTTTAHIGAAAQRLGNNVLLIDLAGKQGDLAKQFGLWETVQEDIANEDDFPNIDTAFKDEFSQVATLVDGPVVDELVYETAEGVDLIPGAPGTRWARQRAQQHLRRNRTLRPLGPIPE